MTRTAHPRTLAALAALLTVVLASASSAAQPPPPLRDVPRAAAVRQSPADQPPARVVAPADVEETRGALRAILIRYPETVRRVISLDPSLLQNPAYLEPYPELAAFLQQHPEVARNGADYLREFRPSYYVQPDRDSQVIRLWDNLFQGAFIFLVFAVVTGAFVWLFKTLIDYRRWYRLSKVQTDAHNKLLDRFANNEDLLAYISTPTGQRFLESAPIMLDGPPSSVGAPVRRILWAIEIGVVLVCLGGGIFLAQAAAPVDVQPLLFAVSIVVAAVGIGFVLAALASYLLSRMLGVLGQGARPKANGDAQPGA